MGQGCGVLEDPAHRRRCRLDKEIFINADELEPFVTWGTNPGQGVPLSQSVPSPDDFEDENDKVAGNPRPSSIWAWRRVPP